MRDRREIKKEAQQEALERLYTLMSQLESKGLSVSEINKRANIEGTRLYELLKRDSPRGLSNLPDIIKRLESIVNIDVDMNIDEYKSLYQKLDEISKKQDTIIAMLNDKK